MPTACRTAGNRPTGHRQLRCPPHAGPPASEGQRGGPAECRSQKPAPEPPLPTRSRPRHEDRPGAGEPRRQALRPARRTPHQKGAEPHPRMSDGKRRHCHERRFATWRAQPGPPGGTRRHGPECSQATGARCHEGRGTARGTAETTRPEGPRPGRQPNADSGRRRPSGKGHIRPGCGRARRGGRAQTATPGCPRGKNGAHRGPHG